MGTRAGLFFVNKLIDNIDAPTDQDFPEFILHNNSGIPDRTLAILYGGESPEKELLRSIGIMKRLNVDYTVLTCITSYHFVTRFDEKLQENIINPVTLTLDSLQEKGYKKIGLLATTGTIKSKLFHQRKQLEIITLDEVKQEKLLMKSIYMNGGLKSSKISGEAYYLFEQAFNTLKNEGVDAIVGGCSEVQIGHAAMKTDFPYLDSMSILVDEVIHKMNLKKNINGQKVNTYTI